MTPPPRDPLAHLAEALADLERRGLRRRVAGDVPSDADAEAGAGPAGDPEVPPGISFCSNDYLGLASRRAPQSATGAGASRLISGDRPEHRELEEALTRWLGLEAGLLFSSGYAANLGTLAAIAGPGDLLISDALNHASIVDGARLSRARTEIVAHNDVDAIDRRLAERGEPHAWVVVESYYSMDADGPDLGRLRAVCDAHGAGLMVDEAHAFGVLGPGGRGRAAEAGVRPDILVGTLGKALGSQGAFVMGTRVLRDWLWNRARSFVFSTGLAPVAAEAGRLALELVQANPDLCTTVAARAAQFRAGVAGCPGVSAAGFGHIIPLTVGDTAATLAFAQRLRGHGLVVPAIRPPTVPEGTARLRFTVTARHTTADVEAAVRAIRRTAEST